MRSIILKSMLAFCMVICAMGMIVIPFMMQFNQANPLLLNWFVMCVFGLLVAIMMYQTELEYEQEINELELAEIEEDTLVCGQCGSANILQWAKVNPNNMEVEEFADYGLFDEPYYCYNDDCPVETFDEATSYHKGEA
jgi:hypothetical protein